MKTRYKKCLPIKTYDLKKFKNNLIKIINITRTGNKDYFDKDLYSKLHYCKAVVEEGLRLRPIAPTVSPHFSIQNSTLQGYHIPKDVNIFCNVWSVHRDPKFWSPDPDSFRPERHLDENGRFTPTGRVMTFSLGRRQCGGSKLAKQVIMTSLVNLLAQFKIRTVDGVDAKEIGDGQSIRIYTTPFFEVVLTPRY